MQLKLVLSHPQLIGSQVPVVAEHAATFIMT